MKNNFVLDTSFISALFNKSDIHHDKSIELLSKIITEKLYISAVTYTEILMLINKGIKIKAIKTFLLKLDLIIVDVNSDFLGFYENFLSLIDFKITTLDAIIMSTSVYIDAKLITFDKSLEKKFDMLEVDLSKR